MLKRILTGVVFSLALLAHAAAQEPHGVTLSDHKWKERGLFGSKSKFVAERSGQLEDDYPPPGESGPERSRPSDVNQPAVTPSSYTEASVRAFNGGGKIVTAVTWEYVFYRDAGKAQVFRSERLRSRKRIRPGQTVRLREAGYYGLGTRHQAVRVVGLEYADGTSWQAP